MKNKITKSILMALGLIAFSTQSCQDYLDEELVSGVSAGSYYTTAAGLEDAVDATYSFLREIFSNERAYMLSIFGTDTHTNGADGGWKSFNFYDNGLNPSAGILGEQWTFLYKGINQANAVLNRSESVTDLNEATKITRQAEVRFLRAFYYFYLVQTWGDVHFTLEETVGAEVTANKTPQSQIYSEGIIPDLEFAVANLPDTQSNYGRATKPAAQFLLGKVYLTRGYTTFGSASDFTTAETLLTSVIDDYGFALVPSHKDLWDQDKQINSEVIWAVQYSTDLILNGGDTGVGNRGHLYFGMEYDVQPGMIRDIANGRPFKRFRPTDYMIGVWATARVNDQRYEDTYKHVWYCNDTRTSGNGIPLWKQIHVDMGAKKADGSTVTAADIGKRRFEVGDTALYIPGPGQDAKWLGDEKLKVRYTVITKDKASYAGSSLPTSDPNYYPSDPFYYNERLFPTIAKFFDPRRPTIQWERGSRDWFVMRLADALLLRAEARFKNGNNDGAAEDINVVRTRAAKPGKVAEMQITAADINIDRILLERALELDAEQCRWFDLTRTGKLVEYVTLYNPLGAPNIQDYHVHRPIPQLQIDRTLGGYPQNCGYSPDAVCN
ncbi:MAG TPA: RagB/SusD family nutrient uptake outer membrane protein [Cyclobacteriaceae bacterium]|nr:RagB/SusD family nutrient uptake outer membrane protein [Cyclobacteriaceae bacterium]